MKMNGGFGRRRRTVQVPSISNALSTISCTHFSTASRSLGLFLSYKILSWKLPSPICPRTLANRPKSSISFFDISRARYDCQIRLSTSIHSLPECLPMMSESRDSGTATSVDQTSEPFSLKASMLHSASFRADQSVFCSSASRANSKSPALWHFVIALTVLILSSTYRGR